MGEQMKVITDAEFNKMREYVKTNYGISFNDEKKTMVQSRLRTIITDLGFDSFTTYFEFIRNNPKSKDMVEFINKITTNHTFFMREPEHFDYFRDITLPYVEESFRNKRELNMWCCACSSGEEAITLQIIAQEFFKKTEVDWNTQMLATDISTKVLDKAVHAHYPTENIANLPKTWQLEYFEKVDATYSKVKQSIKSQIAYRKFNMMSPFNFKRKFHVIFCRNVMIYFDTQTRDSIVKKFYDVTEPGGYLFIGHSESVSNSGSGFQYIKPAVYRKPI